MISWTHGTTGIADVCAPSRDGPNYPDKVYVDGVNKVLNKWVQKGYAVLKTDYEGLGTPGTHPYLNGFSEARSATDIVSAARALDPALSRAWLVMGHSQGGQAAVYTAAFGPLYAPYLDLVGAVAISPGAFLSEGVAHVLAHMKGTRANAFFPLIMVGTAASAPGVNVSSLLSPEGRKLIKAVKTGCLGAFRTPGGWSSFRREQLVNPHADFKPLIGALKTFDDTQNVVPQVPLLVLQAANDHLVLSRLTTRMVDRFKTVGVNVKYIDYKDIPNGPPPSVHRATVTRSLHDAMAWVGKHLPPGR